MAGWANYYVIVGSAAAALVAIQFVVISLILGIRMRVSADSIGAYGTPTLFHLGATLLISAIMTVPWPSPSPLSAVLAACGLGGIVYLGLAMRRARRQTIYQPVFEDWLWYTLLPSAAYVTLALAASLLHGNAGRALFAIAGVALGLLFIGIRNSWDTVTHLVITSSRRHDASTEERPSPPGPSKTKDA